MSDGSQLRQSWYSAVNEAEAYFRQLLTSPSNEWKRISSSIDNSSSSSKKGKARVVGAAPELSDVIVHRNSKTTGSEAVYRVVLDVPAVEEQVSLEPWKAVLSTPELRREWDPAVEEAHLLEVLDRSTQVSKTNFSLGWPANPRDAVTISRSFNDPTTVIQITTSLPRSPDEPAYLRPSPPFVRSHVHLFSWCIRHFQAQPEDSNKPPIPGKIRITCFWQHDFKEMWGLGSSSSTLAQQLSTMILSLFKTVIKRGGRVPKLIGYGNGVSIERIRFQIDREALSVDYAIIPDDDTHSLEGSQHGLDELHQIRENRRLTRSVECVLPSLEGWDVQVTLKASSEDVEQLPWSAQAIKTNSNPSSIGPPDQLLLRITHAALLDDHSVLKVKVVIEASGGTRGLRLNGLPKKILDTEQRDPTSHTIPRQILQDIASAADLSIRTASSVGTIASSISGSPSLPGLSNPERTAAAQKSILSRVKRNYIYFSSLLQEPEAKWRRTTDARGVAITQLDSIDPTLVVYRAEATFVGVGLWDLYGAVTSPGARVHWDKQHEDAVLLEDVNELTELWHFKTKPAWPVNGRDAVVLKTVYKSPTTIHVFAFSADDPHLFPSIPPAESTTIRTQVDLQGWSIEALSPNTTSLTLLEQSDPKGWTNKTSIPTQMINTLAGIGEFAIKCANNMHYDHEKGSFKVEYELSSSRRSAAPECQDDSSQPTIECEIRCDIDTWASSLDIVVDPPPQTMSCLRRHRLSSEGGGLWLTLTHDCVFVDDERHLVIVRRAPGKEKGLVMVNGSKIQVDVEEIPEQELKLLRKKERVRPPRVPLDQPPVMGAVRRRNAEWGDEGSGAEGSSKDGSGSSTSPEGSGSTSPSNSNAPKSWASAPRISSPLSRFLSYAVDQATTTTQQAVAAITPAAGGSGSSLPSATKMPMQYALEALAWAQEFHTSSNFLSSSPADGWTLVSDKGMMVHRKLIPEASSIIPVHKGQKVVEGVSGEELAAIIMEDDCRKVWDDRFDSIRTLESYGNSCRTLFFTAKGGFPFRDRGFYLASVTARTQVLPALASLRRSTGDVADQTGGAKNAIFVVAASFSADSTTPLFPSEKHNPYSLPLGRVYVDAWILETLDPYTKENYAIPSTRCTRLVAMDYAGSIPAAVNSMINASLPRAILSLESYFKSISSLPAIRLPASSLVLAEKKAYGSFEDAEICCQEDAQHESSSCGPGAGILRAHGDGLAHVFGTVTVHLDDYIRRQVEESGDESERGDIAFCEEPRCAVKRYDARDDGVDSDGASACITRTTVAESDEQAEIGVVERRDTLEFVPLPSWPIRYLPFIFFGARLWVGAEIGRGRTMSSAFTAKGEVKPVTDLVVGEVVVDTRMYPDGYYVVVRSRKVKKEPKGSKGGSAAWVEVNAKGKGKELDGEMYLRLGGVSSTSGEASATIAKPSTNPGGSSNSQGSSGDDGQQAGGDEEKFLPLAYSIHTMPASPMHSSSLITEGGAVRHLLRFSLPTAQYQVSSVKDPLTGELRTGPKKPLWLRVLEGLDEEEVKPQADEDGIDQEAPEGSDETAASKLARLQGAVVEIEVLPLSKASDDKDKEEKKRKRIKKVKVNDVEIPVVGEKESLTSLGREELLDDRIAKMSILLRTPNESEALPEELRLPIAIADDLVDPAVRGDSASTGTSGLLGTSTVYLHPDGDGSKGPTGRGGGDAGVSNVQEAEEANKVTAGGGWREIRRLLEIKYILGGWDFQVAAVRRHM
ncbi:hypothetical protein H1R20_g7047, partial [Candolleomyces eurysporus]